MKKKRRAPGPQRSAFESARAALERAGEDPSEVRTPEPSGSAEAPAPVESAEPSAPETVEAFAPVDSPEAPDGEEASDSAEASETTETPDSAEASETAETPDSAEASETAETPDSAETSDDAETPNDAEALGTEVDADAETSETAADAEASDASESAEATQASDAAEASEEAAPQEPDALSEPEADAPLTETASAVEVAEPLPEVPDAAQAVEPLPEEDASETDDDEEYGFLDEDDEEFAETERHSMMETKEITVGYHRAQTAKAEPPKEPKEHKKKATFKTLNLDKVKDALRGHGEKEPSEPQGNGDSPSAGSSRDAAIRKRVMQIADDETRNYLLDRVLPQMIWYSKRSEQYRMMYYRLMAATIMVGGLIPVFSVGGSYALVKVILAFLGASVTGINAYIALHNYHDLWITYQKTREDLIHTLYCYFNGAGVFSQKKMSEKDLNVLLVDVCEDTLSRETGGWTTIVQKT